jgi:hypothetical protein
VSAWESLLPAELLHLPEELARVDALLDDPVFFAPRVDLETTGERRSVTGPEHYKMAEYLIHRATVPVLQRQLEPQPGDHFEDGLMIAAAQVHATLALAAATAPGSSGHWSDAAGESSPYA